MFATIWMCTQEWSLICSRTTAFTFETCHQALSCVSALTRSSTRRSLRLPRAGRRICICSTASAGVSRASATASADRDLDDAPRARGSRRHRRELRSS